MAKFSSRLTAALYNTALLGLYPALGAYVGYRRYGLKKSVASVRGMLGQVPAEIKSPSAHPAARDPKHPGPRIWLHAVSVGETVAARPIARALRALMPGATILLSNTTDTGHEVAQGMLTTGEVDGLFFFPLDLPSPVAKVLNRVRPDAILFVETELWPNLLDQARRRGIVTFLVNGRVSENLQATAPKLGPLWAWMLDNIDGFLMRNADDADRIQALGAAPGKVQTVGDVKLELPPLSALELRGQGRASLGLDGKLPVWVAGSTHPDEERMALEAYGVLKNGSPDLRLALAPRHRERADEVAALIGEMGYTVCRRSSGDAWKPDQIFLLDTVGELADFFAVADVAFVGGSLIKRGGHNVLEPVLRGVPVLFGPYMMNFRAAAELVTTAGLGTQLKEETELAGAVAKWLADEEARADFPRRVEVALGPHRGAAARLAKIVAESLGAGQV